MTDAHCRSMIADRYGDAMRSTSGLPGDFYTSDRERDIRTACRDLLASRGESRAQRPEITPTAARGTIMYVALPTIIKDGVGGVVTVATGITTVAVSAIMKVFVGTHALVAAGVGDVAMTLSLNDILTAIGLILVTAGGWYTKFQLKRAEDERLKIAIDKERRDMEREQREKDERLEHRIWMEKQLASIQIEHARTAMTVEKIASSVANPPA